MNLWEAAGSGSSAVCQLEWLPRCPDFLGALCALGYQSASQPQPDEQDTFATQPCNDLASLPNLAALIRLLPLALKVRTACNLTVPQYQLPN